MTAVIDTTFIEQGDFAAADAAEAWLGANGWSVGPMQGPDPRGIMPAEYIVAKWRNLTTSERAGLHGTMTGDMRNGPVRVLIDGPGRRR